MFRSPVVISLPIADRRASCAFYRELLDLEPIGKPAEDGVPEPLQFALNDGARLMLVPTGGFDWVIGARGVMPPDHSECVLGLGAETPEVVDALVGRAITAGAAIVTEPAQQPWGYTGAFADPDGHVWMVTAQPLPS